MQVDLSNSLHKRSKKMHHMGKEITYNFENFVVKTSIISTGQVSTHLVLNGQ